MTCRICGVPLMDTTEIRAGTCCECAEKKKMSNSTEIGIKLGCVVTTSETPTIPDAQRGHYSPTNVRETRPQLDAGLLWTPCTFCGGFVLITAQPELKSRKREKCYCGAKRVFRWGPMTKEERRSGFSERPPTDGWSKNGEEWVTC